MAQNLSLARMLGDDHDVKRDVVIKLLVTKDERLALQKAAAADQGVSADDANLSEFIRSRLIKTTTTVEVAASDIAKPRAKKAGR